MVSDEQLRAFTPTHHALLFAWIARAVVRRTGEAQGQASVRRAVRRYGEQRGRRMALRAQADGQALTMNAYRAYGEWEAPEGETPSEVVREAPNPVAHVLRCPWHRAWEAQGLMDYGRLYCLEVDHALVRGFNPELRLDVNRLMSAGEDCCEFVYHGADLEEKIEPAKPSVMLWDYHLGHLCKTMGEVIVEDLGEQGAEAIQEALAEFAAHYGQKAAGIVQGYGDTDFERLPA
jgi:hypothetical protein